MTTRTVTVNWQGLGAGARAVDHRPGAGDRRASGRRVARHGRHHRPRARRPGRRVVRRARSPTARAARSRRRPTYCNAPADAAPAARYGLLRDKEARDAMSVLGLTWSTNLSHDRADLPRLSGRPGRRTSRRPTTPLTNSADRHPAHVRRGLRRAASTTCNGDFRYLLSGTHSQFTASALRADLDSLLTVTAPTDIYTHASFDGHPDHAEIAKQVLVGRAPRQPAGARPLDDPAPRTATATAWRSPRRAGRTRRCRTTTRSPASRRRSTSPRRRRTRATRPTRRRAGARWARRTRSSTSPPTMQTTTEATNKKWQTISRARVADRLHEPRRVPRQLRLHAGVRQAQRVLLALRLRQQAGLAEVVHRATGRRTRRSPSRRRSSRASGATRATACARSRPASTAR